MCSQKIVLQGKSIMFSQGSTNVHTIIMKMYISQCFSFSLWILSSGDTYNIKHFKNSNSTFGIRNTRNGKNTSLLQAMLSHSFQFKIKSLIIKIINAIKRKLNWRNITGPTDRNVNGKQQQQKTAVFQSISHPLSYKSKF